MTFDKALRAWQTARFQDVLKQEIARHASELPLQKALSAGNYVVDAPITATINSVEEMPRIIRVNAGIFFRSIIAGCSCESDPTPTSEIDEYCEVRLDIDKATGAAAATLIAEGDN